MAVKLRLALRSFSDFENAIAEEIGRYRERHPQVEIEVVPLVLDDLHREMFQEGGLKSGAWDLGLVSTDWLAEAVDTGALEELTPWLAAAPVPDWPQGWARSIVEPVQFGGELYALPWHDGPECLIYRKDLFTDPAECRAFRAKYAYELAPPRTWQQFNDVAAFFTRPAQGRYGTLVAAFPDGHNTLYDFALQLWSRGGALHDAAGAPCLVTPEAIAALDFYRRLVRDAGRCYPGGEKLDSVQSGDVFLSGKIAMMVNWFGFAARCDRPGESPLQGKVAIAPIPAAAGVAPCSLSVFWTIGIGSGSRHKAEAYDFIRFLMQAEQDRSLVTHGAVGCRLSTWRDADVQARVAPFREIEAISLAARRLPRSSRLPAFAALINRVLGEALATERPSAEILSDAQASAQELQLRLA